jgi:hypothetical protein
MSKKPAVFTILFLVAAVGAWLLQVDVVRAGPLAGLWHLDEDVGVIATDSSDNGNVGTLLNGAFFTTPAKFGEHAVSFDGTDDFVRILKFNYLVLEPEQLTVELWVKSAAPGSYAYLVAKGSQGCSAPSYTFNKVGGGGGLFFDVWNGSVLFRSPETPPSVFDGNWHHVAGTFDGTYVRIYMDGVQVGTGTSVTGTPGFAIKYDLPTTTDLLFGNYDAGGTCPSYNFHYSGLLDEVRIWSRALEANEVLASAQAGLRGLWHFNESPTPPPTTTADSSGYDNTGTLQGNATFAAGVAGVNGNFGNALTLDGTGDFVTVPNSSALNPSGAITVEAWVNVAEIGFYPAIVSKGNVGNYAESYALFVDPSGFLGFLVNTDGTSLGRGIVITSPAITPSTWVHVAGTYDGAKVKTYLNGVLSTVVVLGSEDHTGTIHQLTDPVLIGKADRTSTPSPYPDSFFKGKIDEAHIWARALSAAEIAFIYNTATRAELIVPGEISQELGSGAVFASDWHYSGPGSPQKAMGLEFIVSNDDLGSTMIKGPAAIPPCVTDRGSTPGNPALAPVGLLGCQTGIGGKSALISGKQVDVTTGKKTGPSKTLHLHVNLSDGSHLGTNIQWR